MSMFSGFFRTFAFITAVSYIPIQTITATLAEAQIQKQEQKQEVAEKKEAVKKVAVKRSAFDIERQHWERQANGGTIRIITKGLGCTCTNIASDMSKVLNKFGKVRVLPVLGTGSLQGIADILYLKGIDFSILQSDVYEYVRRNKIHSSLGNRLRYITKLHASELHLIASKDIKSLQDLEGKVVSFDAKGRGSFITAQNVFNAFNIRVKPVRFERDLSIQKIKNGEISAAFVVTGRPASSMRKIKDTDKLHFLPIPYKGKLVDIYMPSELTHKDYPGMIAQGQKVPTIAVSEVLAVYNWQPGTYRYRKIERFINTFFDKFEEFQKPIYHKKWKQVSLTAEVPGWKRFPAAQKKLLSMAAKAKREGTKKVSRLQETAKGQKSGSMSRDEKLFNNFRKWMNSRQ